MAIPTLDIRPQWGIVLGSGLQSAACGLRNTRAVPLQTAASAVPGHGAEILTGTLGRTPVHVATGRRHFYESVPDGAVVFNVALFASLGVKNVILCNAAGSLCPSFRPGSLMLIEDHIDMTFHHHTSRIVKRTENAYPRARAARFYDDDLFSQASQSYKRIFNNLQKGVYAFVSGPFYETRAEIRALRALGADAVGMSTVPEAIYASACGMRVLAVSVITNMATGLAEAEHHHADVVDAARKSAADLGIFLEKFINSVPSPGGDTSQQSIAGAEAE